MTRESRGMLSEIFHANHSSGKRTLPLLLLICIFILMACGNKDRAGLPPEPEEGVLIYAGLNPMDKALELQIKQFNEEHTDVQIQFRDYSDEGGPQRLLVELALGRVPDIMELQRIGRENTGDVKNAEVMYHTSPLTADLSNVYWMPYRQMAQKGYLEDLWPYIENDPALGREGVLEAPLKAAEVNGGLYMLFGDVSVNTLIGSRDMFGDRWGWTMEEMKEAFAAMPPGATVLQFDATQYKVFRTLMSPMLDQYVDWEAGECHFDNDDFRGMVEFLKLFPAECDARLKPKEIKKRIILDRLDGLQMLETVSFVLVDNAQYYNNYFKSGTDYIGYPTADGSPGRSFVPLGSKLGMSSVCQNKEAAWEFMRKLILPRYGRNTGLLRAIDMEQIRIRVNRREYEDAIYMDLKRAKMYKIDYHPISPYSGGPEWRYYYPVQEDADLYERVIATTTGFYWPNEALSDVVWDAIAPCLAGDRSVEDTIDMVQNRVGLYVNEQR